MTRINTIDPKLLTNEWLVAEWRELPRVPNELIKHPNRYKANEVPASYTMGPGHVKFFRNKLLYLQKRHVLICREMDKRNIKRDLTVVVDLSSFGFLSSVLCKDWQPTAQDHNVNIERLIERWDERKKDYHFGRVKLDCDYQFNRWLKIIENKTFRKQQLTK